PDIGKTRWLWLKNAAMLKANEEEQPESLHRKNFETAPTSRIPKRFRNLLAPKGRHRGARLPKRKNPHCAGTGTKNS
ncbi:MAG: hypothetical protein ACP5EM_08985, partial [Acidithiobacillus sp.]